MNLRALRLRHFRNFAELELVFPPAGVAIIGENGAGKTNLLEAICYLEIFRSFRGAPDEQLVRFGSEAFHLRGQLGEVEEAREVSAAFELRGKRKRVTVNGAEPQRIGDALGQVGAVIFSPSDVSIVQGSPAERRRFLDIVLSLNSPGYLAALQRYRQVLRHRNAALRAGQSAAALSAWDDALIETGARVVTTRAEWVARHSTDYASYYARISNGLQGTLSYRSSLVRRAGDEITTESVAEVFRSELLRTSDRERDQGVTVVGPHRDDLGFHVASAHAPVELRDFGSGGQVRTAAISLRLIEADSVRAARTRDPLILLDDVFAELDQPRSQRILELLETGQPGQVILTAPKKSDLQVRGERLEQWSIAAGEISA